MELVRRKPRTLGVIGIRCHISAVELSLLSLCGEQRR